MQGGQAPSKGPGSEGIRPSPGSGSMGDSNWDPVLFISLLSQVCILKTGYELVLLMVPICISPEQVPPPPRCWKEKAWPGLQDRRTPALETLCLGMTPLPLCTLLPQFPHSLAMPQETQKTGTSWRMEFWNPLPWPGHPLPFTY